jgi:hypothetical protein
MSRERECPLHNRPCGSHGTPTKIRTIEERLASFVEEGEAEHVAHIVLNELKHLPDSEKRDLVATAAENEVKRIRGYNSRALTEGQYFASKIKKAKELRRSKKEGTALEEQLQGIYSFARVKS